MNLKISSNELRFRLESGDLDKLLSLHTLQNSLSLPGSEPFVFGINLSHGKGLSILSKGVNSLVVELNTTMAESLKSEKLTKDSGVKEVISLPDGSTVKVIIEVDLFKKRKHLV